MSSFEIDQGVMIYYLPKELDHYEADWIKKKSEKIFCSEQVRYLIFDFEKTTFMDSSGIGLLTGRYRRVSDHGGRVFAIHVNEAIDRVLLLSGIYRIIEKKESKEEVVKAMLEGGCYE